MTRTSTRMKIINDPLFLTGILTTLGGLVTVWAIWGFGPAVIAAVSGFGVLISCVAAETHG